MGSHDMVRRVDASGEVVVWCRTRSGCSRGRLGSKLRNRWNLEAGIVPDRSVEYCKVWRVKMTMRSIKGSGTSLKQEASWRSMGCGACQKKDSGG